MPDLRTATLLRLVDPFMEVMSQLMERQHKTPPPALGKEEMQTLGTQVKDALTAWAQLNIPDTLGHLDSIQETSCAPPTNASFLTGRKRTSGPPFLTFQYLIEHLRQIRNSRVSLALSSW